MIERRKPVTLADRIKPCEGCSFPISQRHHAIPFNEIGESPYIINLCANCHDLYHILWGAFTRRKKGCLALYGYIKSIDHPDINFSLPSIERLVRDYLAFQRWIKEIPIMLEDKSSTLESHPESSDAR